MVLHEKCNTRQATRHYTSASKLMCTYRIQRSGQDRLNRTYPSLLDSRNMAEAGNQHGLGTWTCLYPEVHGTAQPCSCIPTSELQQELRDRTREGLPYVECDLRRPAMMRNSSCFIIAHAQRVCARKSESHSCETSKIEDNSVRLIEAL